MGDPREHLPAPFPDNVIHDLMKSINYPEPIAIKPLQSSAAYHAIYFLTYTTASISSKLHANTNTNSSTNSDQLSDDQSTTSTLDLILRVSGNHIPSIKTENEAAILSWLRQNTPNIPVPDVLHFDKTTANPLGAEYMLATRVPGKPVGELYDTLTPEELNGILDQLAEVQITLWKKPFEHIGGLKFASPLDPSTTTTTSNSDNPNSLPAIIPGPAVEETFWNVPSIAKRFPATESFETINIHSPSGYQSYTAYIADNVSHYVHIIGLQESLAWIQPQVPLLNKFIELITSTSPAHEDLIKSLNASPLRLAHRDLHFGNILMDPTTHRLTAILDWEFSLIGPLPIWNRGRPFVWNPEIKDTAASYAERNRVYEIYKARVVEQYGDEGRQMLQDEQWANPEQEAMFTVQNFTRATVEVCPRGRYLEASRNWWAMVEKALKVLGIEEDKA